MCFSRVCYALACSVIRVTGRSAQSFLAPLRRMSYAHRSMSLSDDKVSLRTAAQPDP
jgi:hypothetical protein